MTRHLFAAALAGCVGLAGPARAQAPALARMNHASWTARDGAPQGITRLAQAPDGTLWIGTQGGLYRFDGRTFTPFQSPPGEPETPADRVQELLVTRDGTVWAGYYRSGLARIARGRVTRFEKAAGWPVRMVTALRETRDGSVWAACDGFFLMRLARGDTAWQAEAKPADELITGLYIDSYDVLWLAQKGRMFRRQLPGNTYTLADVRADAVFAFAEAPGGDVWVSDYDRDAERPRTQRFDRQGRPLATLTHPGEGIALLHTPDGSLLLSLNDEKLYRFNAEALSGRTTLPLGPGTDSFGGPLGPGDRAPAALLLDSDGNLWVGGRRGLGRLRAPRLVPFHADSTWEQWNLCSTPGGGTYASAGGLFSLGGGGARRIPGAEEIRGLSCGADGVVRAWSAGLLYEVRAGRLHPLPWIPGVHPYALNRLAALPDGTLYAFVGGDPAQLGGVWRFRDGAWTKYRARRRLLAQAGDGPYVDSRGRLWVGYNRGQVGLPLEDRLYSSGTPGLENVAVILETSRGHFAAGSNGLAVLRDTSFRMLRFADRASTRGVAGLVESRNGDLYLNAVQGIVRLPAAELAAGLADPRYPMKTERITEGDFTGPAGQYHPATTAAARAADGTLWFTMLNGLVSYDPGAPPPRSRPPVLSIRSITADRVPLGARRRFGPQPRTLSSQSFGVHLAAPDRVRYRYKLDGFDDEWQDAGGRTEAIYTRPGPGTYTFRVMAANEAGAWTAPVVSAPFTVLPSFYQTSWFAVLAAAAVIAIVWLVYTLRVRSITALVQARAEERADERIRIARELHDTLLGGMTGIMMGLGAVARRERAPDARALEALYDQTRRTLVEARQAVVAMRTSTDALPPLETRLREAAGRIFASTGIDARVVPSGTPRPLPPDVDEQVLRVATEAMTNARAHAACRVVEVTCAYGPRELTLRVRDDGRGFDPAVAGANGHYGLVGMRERAAAIGARLTVRSAPGAGTEVALVVPAAEGRRRWWSRSARPEVTDGARRTPQMGD